MATRAELHKRKRATWAEIRNHYAHVLGVSELNQDQIAEAGGIDQSSISKLLDNQNLGPSVAIFVSAVRGLGILPSDFFASIERKEPSSVASILRLVKTRSGATPTYQELSESDEHALEIGRYVLQIVGGLRPPTRPASREDNQ